MERILDAAEEVFLAEGYEGANLNEVIAKVGGSKRTIYTYFGGKLDLFKAVVERLAQNVDQGIDALDTTDVYGSLCNLCLTHLDQVTGPAQLAVFRLVLGEQARNPEVAQEFFAAGPMQSQRNLEQFLMRLNASGGLVIPDVAQAADLLLGGLRGLAHLEGLFCNAKLDDAELRKRVDFAVTSFLKMYPPTT